MANMIARGKREVCRKIFLLHFIQIYPVKTIQIELPMYPSSESPNRLDRSLFLAGNCSFGLEISEYPYPSSEPVLDVEIETAAHCFVQCVRAYYGILGLGCKIHKHTGNRKNAGEVGATEILHELEHKKIIKHVFGFYIGIDQDTRKSQYMRLDLMLIFLHNVHRRASYSIGILKELVGFTPLLRKFLSENFLQKFNHSKILCFSPFLRGP